MVTWSIMKLQQVLQSIMCEMLTAKLHHILVTGVK